MPGVAKPIEQQNHEDTWRSIGRYVKGNLFGEPVNLPASESGKYTLDFNPVEAFDKNKNPEGAIYASPDVNWQESQIRGVAKPAAKLLRKLMQSEFKLRGASPVARDIPTSDLNLDELYSRILRGTWFRGQEAPPKITGVEGDLPVVAHRGKTWTGRPDLRTEEPRAGNVGEPRGISLSYDPAVSRHFAQENLVARPRQAAVDKAAGFQRNAIYTDDPAEKAASLRKQEILLKKADIVPLDIGERRKINRMLPMFEGAPENNILVATKPEHGAILNEEYTKAANRMLELYPGIRKEVIQGKKFHEAVSRAYSYEEGVNPTKHFNEILTEGLQSRGFKGMLHSPHRYDEYELRMFDTRDVVQIDKRRAPTAKSEKYKYHMPWEENSSVARLRDMKEPLRELHEGATEGRTGAHLYEWYNQIPEEALAGKWAKPREKYLNRIASPKADTDKLLKAHDSMPESEKQYYLKHSEDLFKSVGDGGTVDIADAIYSTSGNEAYANKILDTGYISGLIGNPEYGAIKSELKKYYTTPGFVKSPKKTPKTMSDTLDEFHDLVSELNSGKVASPATPALSTYDAGKISWGSLDTLKKHAKQMLADNGNDVVATKKVISQQYMDNEITGLDYDYLSKSIMEHYKALKKGENLHKTATDIINQAGGNWPKASDLLANIAAGPNKVHDNDWGKIYDIVEKSFYGGK